MATPITTTTQTHRDFRQHTVEVADTLAGPWTPLPHVYCDRLQLVAGGIDSAVLSFHFGELIQPGLTRFLRYELLELRRKLVRITIDQGLGVENFVWYGVIIAETQQRDGAFLRQEKGATKRSLAGDVQLFTAAGLEWFLDRQQITTAHVYPGTEIGRSITFNEAGGFRQSGLVSRGNRDTRTVGGGYVFAEKLADAELWSAWQIVDYVMHYHTPDEPVNFILRDTEPLAWFTPTVHADGRTALAILSELASPRRGLSWRLEIEGTDARVRVFSFTDSEVSLPSGTTLPANPATRTLDFDRALDIDVAELSFVEARKYDRVRARGARRGACFTVSVDDGTLEADWNSALTAEYRDAASGEADYASLSVKEKKARNDDYRRSEKFARVFRCFRLPTTWDGMVGSGDGGNKLAAFPVLSSGGVDPNNNEPFWIAGLRFTNELPLLTDTDYTQNPPTNNAGSGQFREPRPPFVIMEIDPDAGGEQVYQYADQLDTKGRNGEDKLKASYYLRMQDASFGIELRPAGGLPHLLASNGTDWPSTAEPTQYEPELDWRKCRATLFCAHDTHVEEVYPTGLAEADVREELLLDVGERARLDWLAPKTIVDLTDGIPQLAPSGGLFVRDDRDLLKDISRMAWLWYEEPRAAFVLSYRQLTALFNVGDYIVSIGADATVETVGTVITSIDYNLVDGTTTVRTDFAELDFREFLPL